MEEMLKKYDTDGSISNLIEMERESPELMLEPEDLAQVLLLLLLLLVVLLLLLVLLMLLLLLLLLLLFLLLVELLPLLLGR